MIVLQSLLLQLLVNKSILVHVTKICFENKYLMYCRQILASTEQNSAEVTITDVRRLFLWVSVALQKN